CDDHYDLSGGIGVRHCRSAYLRYACDIDDSHRNRHGRPELDRSCRRDPVDFSPHFEYRSGRLDGCDSGGSRERVCIGRRPVTDRRDVAFYLSGLLQYRGGRIDQCYRNTGWPGIRAQLLTGAPGTAGNKRHKRLRYQPKLGRRLLSVRSDGNDQFNPAVLICVCFARNTETHASAWVFFCVALSAIQRDGPFQPEALHGLQCVAATAIATVGSVPVAEEAARFSLPAVAESKLYNDRSGLPPLAAASR